MKKVFAAILAIVLSLVFVPSCESGQTVQFQLKIMNWSQLDYFICAENQDVKLNLELENCAYTEEDGARVYDVTVHYPLKVVVREDGRSFWDFYSGFVYEYSETFPYSLKNVGIRSGHTTVRLDRSGGSVLYDTVKTVYDDGSFTFYVGEGMNSSGGSMLHDIQFIWYEDEDGQRHGAGDILPGATIQLLGVNAPDANGDVETWFSVISGAEGVGELHRFCVTTKGSSQSEVQPESALTYADLPDVISEKDAKWLDDAEFAADGIKPDTDVEAMKAVLEEPVLSRHEYDDDIEYHIYQYDGVVYTYETAMKSVDEWLEVNRAFSAVFTKNLLKFPRGIQIGDRFEDVLKKFPQELDYKDEMSENMFYGDYWRKDKLGWGAVHIPNSNTDTPNGVWISVICDEYWPMLKVHFTDDLVADQVVVQFGPSPYYD